MRAFLCDWAGYQMAALTRTALARAASARGHAREAEHARFCGRVGGAPRKCCFGGEARDVENDPVLSPVHFLDHEFG